MKNIIRLVNTKLNMNGIAIVAIIVFQFIFGLLGCLTIAEVGTDIVNLGGDVPDNLFSVYAFPMTTAIITAIVLSILISAIIAITSDNKRYLSLGVSVRSNCVANYLVGLVVSAILALTSFASGLLNRVAARSTGEIWTQSITDSADIAEMSRGIVTVLLASYLIYMIMLVIKEISLISIVTSIIVAACVIVVIYACLFSALLDMRVIAYILSFKGSSIILSVLLAVIGVGYYILMSRRRVVR